MTFTQHYDSPLGGILLAADEIDFGSTEKSTLPTTCLLNIPSWKLQFSQRPNNGWIYISLAMNRILCRHCILSGLISEKQYGRSFHRYLTARPRPTVKYPGSLPKNRDLPGCPRRRSAVQSGITKYPLLFRVTVWSVQMEA